VGKRSQGTPEERDKDDHCCSKEKQEQKGGVVVKDSPRL
jgi:hypothetical protein